MSAFDVFNGDADGICALLQLRLAEPREAALVTGVKRDINLLNRVSASHGDRVTVLDISLDKNRPDLERILASGAKVFYADHHFAGEIPNHPALEVTINTAPETCTSLIVNARLKGGFSHWAIVGAFGDNLAGPALKLASAAGLGDEGIETLRRLGSCLNYNGYGASIDDLHFAPDDLYRRARTYASPFDFVKGEPATFKSLTEGYDQDLAQARNAEVAFETEAVAVFLLPQAAWSRRVSGVFGNDLANRAQSRAHAVLTSQENGYLVSVRAPLDRRTGADEVCRRFETGGGRAAAAGINHLPEEQLNDFIEAMQTAFPALS